NAVNLTDGLDGLAIVPTMIAAGCFACIAYLAGNAIFANYLQIHHIIGAGELTVFCGAMVGASLGFLWFNAPPAMVFMGDTGSLSIGAALGTISVVTKHELVLAIVGGLFVLRGSHLALPTVSVPPRVAGGEPDEVCPHRPKPGGALVVDGRPLEPHRPGHADRLWPHVEPGGEPLGCRADRL